MPIYEYRCGKCDAVIERIQKFSDAPLAQHDGCGGALTKLISQSSFQLKGSGWYVTDYAGKGKSQEGGNGDKPETGEKGDKKEAKESGGKSEGDSKPAAGTEGSKPERSKASGGGAAKK